MPIFVRTFFLFGSALALPAAASTPAPLTLRDALAQALLHSPTLRVEAYEPRLAEARALQAQIRPNPELSLELENGLGTSAFSAAKSLETTLQLSQVIELGETRGRRASAGHAERALAEADYELKRVDVLAEVARRFVQTVADERRLESTRRALELGEQIVATVQPRVSAGAVPRAELNKARTALALLQIDEEHAEHELAVCRQNLAAALGHPDPAFGPAQADLFTLPAVLDFPTLATRLEQSPHLGRFATEARWREAQLRLAQTLRRSDFRVSAGVRRSEREDAVGLVGGITLPLPVRDPAAGSAAEARERRAQIEAAAEARRLELRASLFAVYQELTHARAAFEQLQREIIPLVRETFSLTQAGYAAGRYSLPDLLEAQRAVLDVERQALEHAATFHLHVIEIERLLGAPLTRTPVGS
jgi:cobalt-zinc-cadmium efflux system outer membrane protein